MDDKSIVDLYWARSENAIHETSIKYGKYCYAIAFNILNDPEDAAEMLNDTYMGAWNSMPPNRPAILSTFLGKITRRVSINRWNEQHAQKRGNGEMPLALEELSDAVTASDSISEKLPFFLFHFRLRKIKKIRVYKEFLQFLGLHLFRIFHIFRSHSASIPLLMRARTRRHRDHLLQRIRFS